MTVRSGEHGPAVPRQDRGAADAAQEQFGEATGDPLEGHADDRINEAVLAAQELAEETGGFGIPGRPLDRRSPFFVGMAARPAWRSRSAWSS